MSRKIKILFALMLTVLAIAVCISCDTIKVPENVSVSVTYVYNNGDDNKTEQVLSFSFAKPDDPKRDGYEFVGWCTDRKLENFYNFEQPPQSDITLYAKWDLDYERLVRDIGTDASLAGVKIKVETGTLFSSSTSQGSGVIYKYQNGIYYVLTNYHVVEDAADSYGIYYVYDAYGNEYRAFYAAGDPAYDLAVLYFESKRSTELAVADIDERIPSNTEQLICISSPGGRYNSITLGKALRYEKANVGSDSGTSMIDFEVLWLDCYAEHGSSGGAIMDTDFDIVGITYAVATDKFGNFKYSLVIPAERIGEFLNSNGLR